MARLAPTLDLDALEAFVRVAELRSFTRAAEALGTTQSAISLKVKRLEEGLGRRLLIRTPRLVRLAEGREAFLEASRDLLLRRDAVLAALDGKGPQRLALGISDQAAGPDLPAMLSGLARADPDLLLDVHVGASRELLDRFDGGQFDAVVVRGEDDRRPGEVLVEEPYRWIASPSFRWSPGRPLPLATLAEPCGVRALTIRSLDRAGIAWRDAFVGGGVTALGAALAAGLAVSVLALRVAPPGLVDVADRFGLPPLPRSRVMLQSRVTEPRLSAALRRLAAAFRDGVVQNVATDAGDSPPRGRQGPRTSASTSARSSGVTSGRTPNQRSKPGTA